MRITINCTPIRLWPRSLANDEAEVIAFYCKEISKRSNHAYISIPGRFQTEPRKEVARRLHSQC